MHLTSKNAPTVQLYLTEWVGEKTREKFKKSPSPKPMLDERSMKLTLPFQQSQIVPTLTECEDRTETEMDIGNSKLTTRWF